MRLNVRERQILRERVQKLLVNFPGSSNRQIADHLEVEGYKRKTIHSSCNRIREGSSINDNKKTGRPSKLSKKDKRKLKRLTNNRFGVSQRRLGRQFSVNHTTIGRAMSRMKIKDYKREKTPKYTIQQKLKSKKLSRKLVNHFYASKASILVDDEKYFTLDGTNMSGNDRYYTADKSTCPDNVRFKGVAKFPEKILVWITISERGMSKPLFRPWKSVAITKELYIEECLTKRLLPFIHKYHPDFDYIFWPDLASAHYANACVAWMDENVNFVAKEMNPPNVPKARPIEFFWGCLAQKVYEGGWEAKTSAELIRRIELKLKGFDLDFLQNQMKNVKKNLRKIADGGVYSIYKN